MVNSQIRKLTLALFVSGALNIGLTALFFYWTICERPPTPYFELKPVTAEQQVALDHTNAELIQQFRALSREQLVAKLSDAQHVENGYTQRDLALACLVTFHHFDISRALLGLSQPSQHRAISYGMRKDGKPMKVLAYPELSEQHYQAIISFAQTERWPLTTKGLFTHLHKPEGLKDATLVDAFYLTPEFLAVETLFNRSETPIAKEELLKMINDGTWLMVSLFAEQQKQSQDLSAARRQMLLLQYLAKGSKTAAYILLQTDGPAIVRKLDDQHIKMLLTLLTEKSPDAEKFALALLTSPRGDAIWQLAAKRLYEYAGENFPEKFQHHAALARFLPSHHIIGHKAEETESAAIVPHVEVVPKQALTSETRYLPSKRDRLYIVQEGDSLWKISKRFNINMDVLKRHNRLSTDFLKPGTSLRIP